MDRSHAHFIEREVDELVRNKSLADTEEIDPITVVSISNFTGTASAFRSTHYLTDNM